MHLSSPAFSDGATIPRVYTCDGDDISPPLRVRDVPEGIRSLALIVEDPDVSEGTFAHWVVWNIDPTTVQIGEDSVPGGAVEGRNDFGMIGYGGACPPSGEHHYRFRLFALRDVLDISPASDARSLLRAMEGRILAETTLLGRYMRS